MSADKEAVEAARRLLDGVVDRVGSDTIAVARAFLSLAERAEWRPIEEAPETPPTEAVPWGTQIPMDFYGPGIGVCAGSLHRWPGQPPTARIPHLHGDAVEHWGVTHFRPRPSPPSPDKSE